MILNYAQLVRSSKNEPNQYGTIFQQFISVSISIPVWAPPQQILDNFWSQKLKIMNFRKFVLRAPDELDQTQTSIQKLYTSTLWCVDKEIQYNSEK